ncbi:MAG: hypothetical protein AAF125_11270, partial [Chloroflexota bacterium]
SQRLVERFVTFPTPPDYIGALRAFSAFVNVGTTVMIALAGWRLARGLGAGPATVAGLMAALPWAVAPRVVGTGNLALMDPLIFPMMAAALLFTIVSIQDDSPLAAFGSLLAVIVAIYLKYLVVYALWLPACAVTVLVWRRRWRAAPWIVGMGVVSAVTAGWLLFVHRALELENRESEAFYEDGLTQMLSPFRNLDNLAFTLSETIGIWLFSVVLIGGVLAWIVAHRRGDAPAFNLLWLWMLLPFLVANLMLTSSVDVLRTWSPEWFRVRYTLPGAMVLMLLWGVGVAQVAVALRASGRRLVASALVGVLALVTVIPATTTHVANAERWSEQHSYEGVWRWADGTLPPDGKFLVRAASAVSDMWNRPWSGYDGSTTFEWGFAVTPQDETPDWWAANEFTYYMALAEELATDDALAAWAESLYLIKAIPSGVGISSDLHIYRTLPPEVTTRAELGGEVEMVGYDISDTTVGAGEVLTVRPYWRAPIQPSGNYSTFIHLLPEGEAAPVAQWDGPPVSDQRLPVTWDDPSEVLLGASAMLPLPSDLEPGQYTLAIGLYNFETGARLTQPDGTDHVAIPVTVQR